MFYLILVVVLAGVVLTGLMQAREEAEAEMSDQDFEHNEGEETYDEDL